MSDEPTAGDDARTAKDAPTTEKRSGSANFWDPTEPVDLDHLVPLDMANNIDDERTKQRITWVDGFGRAYADALEDAEPEATDEDTIMTDGGQNENMAYWQRNLEAALSSMEPETAVTPRLNADDLVITPVGGSTRKERAELIHALEVRGFEVISSSQGKYIKVDVTDDRLDYPFVDEDRRAMTDGGIETADELEHDPRAFKTSLTPAIVEEVLDDDSVSKVSFANVQLRGCGALHWEEWSGASGLLPNWRWSEVRYLDTERADRDGTRTRARICADDWDRLPTIVQNVVNLEDDPDEPDLVTDGGHRPGHPPSTTSPPDPDAYKESSSTNGGVTRLPEMPGFERDILLTLARSQPTNGQGLLADLSTLRDEEVGDARLYPHLNGLADAGLVDKRENYHDDRSHEYRLADAGGRALREHAQRLEGAVEALSEDQP